MTHVFSINHYGPINLINMHACMQPRSIQDDLEPVHAPKEWPACMQGITIITAGHLKMMEISEKKLLK